MARHKHPGQKNSLDALCRRYDVDNSQRELHGALLDAEILADVYLMMTGGQTVLFMADEVETTSSGSDAYIVVRLARRSTALADRRRYADRTRSARRNARRHRPTRAQRQRLASQALALAN